MDGSYADLGGDEFANNQRTITYLRNGLAPVGVTVKGDCGCEVRPLLGCDGAASTDPYTLPALDPAPWYDINIPESADFAGFLATDVTGWDSSFTRPVNSRLGGGAALGRGRFGQKQITWTGLLLGRTCCSVKYGLRYLTSVLAGTSCASCIGKDLQYLDCCPQDEPDCCPHPPGDLDPFHVCPPAPAQPTAPCGPFKTYKNSGLVAGPTITDKRGNSGCGCGCSQILEVQFTIATDPCSFCDPVDLFHSEPFDADIDCLDPPVWIKDPTGVACIEPACPEAPTCAEDPLCPPPPDPPVYALSPDPCECDPLGPIKQCIEIPKALYGEFMSAVPVVTIYSGSLPMRNVTFRFYENPQDRDCRDQDPCAACAAFRIRFIPAFSQIILDGTDGSIDVVCPGAVNATGESFLTTVEGVPSTIPTFCCIDYCMCIEVDSISIADDSSLDVKIVPRDCPC